MRILSFRVDNKLVAIYPLFETSFGIGPFHPVGYIRPFGADPNLTEIRGPLALPEYLPMVLRWTVKFLMKQARLKSTLHIIGPTAAVRAAEECFGDAKAGIHREVTNYVLPLYGDWEKFRTGLKRNIKESLRRCYNSLKRDGLEHDLQVFTETTAILQNLPQFYFLHAKRAALKSTSVSHPDYFLEPRHRDFMKAVIEALNREADGSCGAHLFCLRINGEMVAMRLAFRCKKEMYFYYSGYDPQYSQYSVMTTLLAESLKWCIEKGLQSANLSVGTDVSKTRWGPQDIAYLETHFVHASLRGRISRVLLELKQRKARRNRLTPAL